MNKLIMAITILVAAACGDNIQEPEPVLNGEECELAEDCAGGVCILELGTDVADDPITFDGGYCSNTCDWDEETYEDIGCAEDEVCLEYYATGEKYCFLEGCASDDDCRDETYTCTPIGFWGSVNVCLPVDASDSDSHHRETVDYTLMMLTPVATSRL